jgi:hypothetical protein
MTPVLGRSRHVETYNCSTCKDQGRVLVGRNPGAVQSCSCAAGRAAAEQDAEVTRYLAIERADQEHEIPQSGHTITIEDSELFGALKRRVCSCGWKGPWHRKGADQ